ncbi:SCO family protein [Desulforhopalus sp. IMCC35007]|uniref:SCO family protein n=1 Tax=Desulforhopalus sp. IMCC35007 TaxID=2569543 RepID=UPI0010AE861A|nr:SCO family protein [Desulforhopalus sp. IMCC35007]
MMKRKLPSIIGVWTLAFLFTFSSLSGVALAEGKSMYKKTLEDYQVPDVKLISQEGKEIELKSYLNSDKPIILDFIYGTCSTICPVLSVSFAHFQRKLGKDKDEVRLVSISIDPDNDTPELMKEHLQKYGAAEGWDAFTGKRENIIEVLKEFDSYVSNKMDHFPLTIMRGAGEEKWVRLYGLLSASDLLKEYEMLKK